MTIAMSYLWKIKNELVFDVKLKQPGTERTTRLRDTLLKVMPKICLERARLLTESMKETEGQPMIIRRAKGLEKILNDMTIFIRPDELIVGNQATEPRAAPVFPEQAIQFLVDELDGEPMRQERLGDRLSEKDEATLREIARWWQGKTVREYIMNLLPDEVYKASFEQVVFPITHGNSGGNGHFVVDYPKVLSKGLSGIIKEAEDKLKNLKLWEPEDFEKRYFLEAVIIVLKAAINFGRRFSRLAREMAEKEKDPTRKAELEKIAEHCEWVLANPARTFWEAMQSLWFAHLIVQIESNGVSISFGRFDQYMYPFYETAIAAGMITPEKTLELIECLWIKSLEINKVKSWYATRLGGGSPMFRPMFQNLTLGGQTRDGRPAINNLSWLSLEATANLRISSPSVSVRCWNGMPEDFVLKCLEVIHIHGGGQPAMFNDEAIILSQLAIGVTLEEAYDYAIVGCVEPSEPGKGAITALFVNCNMLKILEMTLNNGKDPRSGVQLHPNPGNKDLCTFKSFEELLSALKYQIEFYDKLIVSGLNCVGKAFAELTPTPFASALIDDCIKKGKDLEWGGGRYNSAGMIQVGTANVGNCLAALKRVMFEEKRLPPEQIRHALETNFEDNATAPAGEEIRQILLRAPKYGNDDDYADLLVKEVFEFTAKDITRYVVYTTGARANTMEATLTSHIPLGGFCGATPDGRKGGMPVNDGVSPAQGTDVSGPTATLKSVARLNHILCAEGTLLNQKFTPDSFQDLGQLKRLASLLRTYFALRGMHIQFNVISVETLRDAQKHPEEYPNLLIRVAGYTALFTTLEPAIQDEIISRTEQTAPSGK